jgi:hypothetical protein
MNDPLRDLSKQLRDILERYQISFSAKVYDAENNDHDILMDVFGITPKLKRENKQYWGRELGMCWQLLVTRLAEIKCKDFKPALRIEADEPTDLFIGKDAIDTKYRIGSGDSGTLKKIKKYGKLLREQGYNPVLLILRSDNLPAAIKACEVGGWGLYIGEDCFKYIKSKTGFDIQKFLQNAKDELSIARSETFQERSLNNNE